MIKEWQKNNGGEKHISSIRNILKNRELKHFGTQKSKIGGEARLKVSTPFLHNWVIPCLNFLVLVRLFYGVSGPATYSFHWIATSSRLKVSSEL